MDYSLKQKEDLSLSTNWGPSVTKQGEDCFNELDGKIQFMNPLNGNWYFISLL